MTKLYDLASTIRSKNAGVNQVTFDIIFPSAERYQRVLESKAITRDTIAIDDPAALFPVHIIEAGV